MNYTFINRKTKFRTVQRINEEKTNIASISKEVYKDLLDVFSLLRERLRTVSDKLDFERVVSNVLNIVKERKKELARIKRLDDMKNSAGYTLISIIIILSIMGIIIITFLLIKSIFGVKYGI